MSKDISTQFTKECNQKYGRKGYGMWKREKAQSISPAEYGMFLNKSKHSSHKKG